MMKKQNKPWMLTVSAAAKYLGIDEATTQKLLAHVGLSHQLAHGPVIVLTKDLDDYLATAGIMAADQGKVVPLLHQ